MYIDNLPHPTLTILVYYAQLTKSILMLLYKVFDTGPY